MRSASDTRLQCEMTASRYFDSQPVDLGPRSAVGTMFEWQFPLARSSLIF